MRVLQLYMIGNKPIEWYRALHMVTQVESEHLKYLRRISIAQLDEAAVPKQILIVTAEQLSRGPTGKYLRTKMAAHLGVNAVDNSVLQALNMPTSSAPVDRPIASNAINGLRFIVVIFRFC